jgi:hypothetical protein
VALLALFGQNDKKVVGRKSLSILVLVEAGTTHQQFSWGNSWLAVYEKHNVMQVEPNWALLTLEGGPDCGCGTRAPCDF